MRSIGKIGRNKLTIIKSRALVLAKKRKYSVKLSCGKPVCSTLDASSSEVVWTAAATSFPGLVEGG